MTDKVKKIVKIVVDVFFWIFFALALFFTVFAFASQSSTRGYPKFGNTAFFSIQSNSMENSTFEDGGFKKGDLIVTHVLSEQEKNELKVGDVITYYWDLDGDGTLEANTHRITGIAEYNVNGTIARVQTKGDNNETNPVPEKYTVPTDRIECKWNGKKIGGLGSFISFLQKPYGFWPIIIAPLTAFLIYEIVVLVKTIKKTKHAENRIISANEEELIKQRAIEEYLKKQAEEKSMSEKTDKAVDEKNTESKK